MSATKPVRTRPYVVMFDDCEHIIDASSKPAAIAHLARPRVGSIRVAKGKDVTTFIRAGGIIETAGEYPEREVLPELALPERTDDLPKFLQPSTDDARTHGDASAIDDSQ